MPTVVREDLSKNHAILTVTIFRDDIKPKIDSELKRYRQKAQIKGFRQGQVPMNYVKQMFGSSIFADTLNEMFSDNMMAYLREEKLDVLGQPLPTEDQERFSFKVDNISPEYVVKYEIGHVPPFEVQGLDGTTSFERLTISNIDSLVDEDLSYALKRMGKPVPVTDTIQDNDMVKIEATEEGGDHSHTFSTLISAMPENDLKAELMTKKVGDPIRFNARDLDKFEDEKKHRKHIMNIPEHDDKEVNDWFNGTISEVTRATTAEMNQEFFDSYFGGGVSSEEDAREIVKKGILSFYDVRSNAMLMRDFQERLMQLNKIDLPETFLQRWLKFTNETLSAETIAQEFPAFADNLRWTLVRDQIKATNGVEVTDEEVRADFEQRVRNYFKMDLPSELIADSVNRLMQNKKDVEQTTRDIETDKMFAAILKHMVVTDKAIPSEEFHKILDATTGKSQQEQTADATLQEALS